MERPSAWRSAWFHTTKLHWQLCLVDTILATAASTAVALGLLKWSNNAWVQTGVPGGVFLVIIFGFIVVVFGWNFIRAPYRQRNEAWNLLDAKGGARNGVEALLSWLRTYRVGAESLADVLARNATRFAAGINDEYFESSANADDRRRILADLRIKGVIDSQRFPAVEPQMFGGMPMGGSPPYDLYKTTDVGNRVLARLKDTAEAAPQA